jgi:hypothetical protein
MSKEQNDRSLHKQEPQARDGLRVLDMGQSSRTLVGSYSTGAGVLAADISGRATWLSS